MAKLSSRYFQHTFSNGLTLLVEQMTGVRSAAMNLLVPCGGCNDPDPGIGTATVLGEMTLRGAGRLSSRQVSEQLDLLGLQRSMSTGTYHTRYSAAAVAERVIDGLPLYADIVRRPTLADGEFEASRDLSIQALDGLDDDPRSRVLIRLRQQHWPAPFNRNAMGEKPHLQALTADACRASHAARYTPTGSILAIAGDVDAQRLRDRVGELFGDWSVPAFASPEQAPPTGGFMHEHQQSEQTHIGIACRYIPDSHDDYYVARVAIEVLSGGMSGRLFTEIREKRALVYSVSASYASLRGVGSVLGYAGTSTDRAQQTLDQFIHELRRLANGVTEDEVSRARVGLKASTIMTGESTPSRSGAIASDYFIRGRIRPLDEIEAAIEAVTTERVNAFVAQNPMGPFTIVVVGPRPLDVPGQ